MRRISFVLLIFFVSVSCGNRVRNMFDSPIHLVKPHQTYAIKGDLLELCAERPFKVTGMSICDSLMILRGRLPNSLSQLHIFSLTDNSFEGHYITKGRGPGELLSPIIKTHLVSRNNLLYIFDLSLCSAYAFDCQNSIRERQTELDKLLVLPSGTIDSYPVGDGHIVFIPKEDSYTCSLLEESGNEIKQIPIFPYTSGVSFSDKLSSASLVCQDRKILVMAMCMFPQINILDLKTEKRMSIAVSRDYKSWKNTLTQSYDEGHYYYTYITQSADGFMALYYGVPFQDFIQQSVIPHIHVFDWDGNFLYDVQVQGNLKVIATGDGKVLYGVDENDDIYRYDLSLLNL